MTSSGLTTFNPAAADLVLTAFSRCGKSGAILTAEHLHQAYIESNLLNVEWANRGVHLWKSELIQFPPAAPLTKGVPNYALPAITLMVQLAYVVTASGGGASNNRVLGPMSTTEYAALPNPLNQGPPTSYWFDRQITPNMWLWPTPDSNTTYTAFARVLQQIQDVVLPSGVTLDAPYRFFEAFVSGLAKRLAVHYAPERIAGLESEAERQWGFATNQDTENTPLSIVPALGSYYR